MHFQKGDVPMQHVQHTLCVPIVYNEYLMQEHLKGFPTPIGPASQLG